MMDFMTIDNNFFSKRRSVTAKKMVSGKVPDSDIQQILAAGIRVPDHGALNPWKLIVIKGDSLARIDNEIILSEFKKENPDADKNKLRIES